eukprot:1537539-Prymnesium_polylepis.1
MSLPSPGPAGAEPSAYSHNAPVAPLLSTRRHSGPPIEQVELHVLLVRPRQAQARRRRAAGRRPQQLCEFVCRDAAHVEPSGRVPPRSVREAARYVHRVYEFVEPAEKRARLEHGQVVVTVERRRQRLGDHHELRRVCRHEPGHCVIRRRRGVHSAGAHRPVHAARER